jgi:hypothetical protein
MRPTTRTHRASARTTTAGARSRTTTRAATGRHDAGPGRGGRVDPATTINLIIGGSVLVLLGLGWAVGLALTATAAGAAERALLVKVLPWLLVAVGVALSGYGFVRVSATSR